MTLKKKHFRFILFFIILFFNVSSYSQESRLAAEYFRSGEYDNAASIYQRLYQSNNYNSTYFSYFIKSLIYAERYEEAIDAIGNHLKKKPNDIQFYVTEGNIYEKMGEDKKADKAFGMAIDNLDESTIQYLNVANEFAQSGKFDLALDVYNKAIKKSNNPTDYYRKIGDLYAQKGENENMIDSYITYLELSPNSNVNNLVQSTMSRYLGDEDYKILEKKLIQEIQKNPDNIGLIELLSWTYINTGDYNKAYRQITAMDRRFSENGVRVYNLAEDARKAEQYSVATKAYKYIIDNKEVNSPYYLMSVRNYLTVSSDRIIKDTTTNEQDLAEIEDQYKKFIDIYGTNDRSTYLILGLANIEALYLHDIDSAIKLLDNFINLRNISPENKAKAKLDLADYYMIKGEIWEASLLYSQVDKDFKEGELGEIARYKNGKLYYYTGDFEWAQIIFNILKPATTRLISNDAIETSVFITESIGDDSLHIPLNMYANAELLVLQNKYDEAINKMDSINFLFPENNLKDDIWYLKAQIYKKIKNFSLAKKMYEQIIESFPDELKADNAIFELAQMYENIYNDKDKAKELYEKLFLEYPDSTLAIESRKKYRILNGEILP
ncbi:MAG: tetratricopeptide repeat protein [Saprospiraceae bacterium]